VYVNSCPYVCLYVGMREVVLVSAKVDLTVTVVTRIFVNISCITTHLDSLPFYVTYVFREDK